MPRVSKKRQIILPSKQCKAVNIKPGDEVKTFIFNGQITIVKMTKGAAKGIIKHIRPSDHLTDEESLESSLDVQFIDEIR